VLLALALGILVVVGGRVHAGLQRWLAVGPLQVYALELVKPRLALSLLRDDRRGRRGSALVVAVGLAVAGWSPDAVAAVVLATMALAAARAQGWPARRVALLAGASTPFVVAAFVRQAQTARAFGWLGVHAAAGTLHTDGALVLITQRAGAVGLALVLALLATLAAGLVRAARAAVGKASQAAVAAIAAGFVAQVLVQPVLGEGVPLVSFGGSSIVGSFLALAVVIDAARVPHGGRPPRPGPQRRDQPDRPPTQRRSVVIRAVTSPCQRPVGVQPTCGQHAPIVQ
jgi:cell division protein FtsW (lipid II flippase)